MWGPWLIGAAKLSAQMQQGCDRLASEWPNFVSGRVKEGFAFVQRIMQSRTPEQIGEARADFWEKATAGAMRDNGRKRGTCWCSRV
jgi:hypothetical protein